MEENKNKIKELRASRNLSIEEVSDATGIGDSLLRKLESGDRRLNVEHLFKLADFFNVSLDYLTGKDEREEVFPDEYFVKEVDGHNITMLPVIGDIAAGIPMTAIPEKGEYVPLDTSVCSINGHKLEEYFYFRIKGNSMEPTIMDKDVVLVHRQPVVENGQVAIVLCDDFENAACKRITIAGDKLILNSDNRDYAPMVHEGNKCMIIGRVIGRYGMVR
jgi:repressor LexA